MQLMKEGDKWELTIPSELAYGDKKRYFIITFTRSLLLTVLSYLFSLARACFSLFWSRVCVCVRLELSQHIKILFYSLCKFFCNKTVPPSVYGIIVCYLERFYNHILFIPS